MALVSASAAIAAWELCRMANSWGQRVFAIPAVVLTAALAASGYYLAIAGAAAFSLLVPAGALGAALTMLLIDHRRQSVLASILVTACIAVFIGGALFNASFLAGSLRRQRLDIRPPGRDIYYRHRCIRRRQGDWLPQARPVH